jgi:Flp pilus assembly CpaF family ATPase
VLVQSLSKVAVSRGARMLRTALGPAIASWLEDPGVVEVMLNPDGRLWIDRLIEGLVDTGQHLSAADGERILRLVSHHVGAEVHASRGHGPVEGLCHGFVEGGDELLDLAA